MHNRGFRLHIDLDAELRRSSGMGLPHNRAKINETSARYKRYRQQLLPDHRGTRVNLCRGFSWQADLADDFALEKLHGNELPPFVLADIMDGADVRLSADAAQATPQKSLNGCAIVAILVR
jgi:hypothetical protein